MANKDISQSKISVVKVFGQYDSGEVQSSTYNQTCYEYNLTTVGQNNKGSRPISPYSRNEDEVNYQRGTYTRRSHAYKFTETHTNWCAYPPADYTSVQTTASQAAADTRALLQLKEGSSNIAVMAAESNKTIDMISRRIDQIRAFARWARYGPKRCWRKIAGRRMRAPCKRTERSDDEVQNLWLELQYGWLPLMSDLSGLLSTLAGNVAHHTVRARGRSKDIVEKQIIQKPWIYEKGTGVVHQLSKKQYYQTVLEGRLDSSTLALSAAMGLTNPLVVEWELIPFSFVADWFVPIGNTLNALDATSGYTFVGGCRTSLMQFDCHTGVSSYCRANSGGADEEWRQGAATRRQVRMNRSVLTSFPISKVYISENPFTTQRALNSIALLTQTFRSGRFS